MAHGYVRPARPSDVAELALLQVSTWQVAYASILPTSVLGHASDAGLEMATTQWRHAIEEPPGEDYRVLVAVDESPSGSWLAGFAASSPATSDDLLAWDDEDVSEGKSTKHSSILLISTLLVAPRWGRRGHGSRLLAASIDLARDNGFITGITWLLEGDKASRRFFHSAGWEPDGVARSLDMNGTLIDELRYTTTW